MQKRDVKATYQEDVSILDYCFPPCFNRRFQILGSFESGLEAWEEN